MIELWGNDTCADCNYVRNFLDMTQFIYRYVDVATIQFEGDIPRLILEDGTVIIGPDPIINYVKNWLRENRTTC